MTARLAAAFAAGLGGLLVELVAIRRVGLIGGNTAEAAASVVAVFLLGLGAGGLLVSRAPSVRARASLGAAFAYGAVALGTIVADAALGAMSPGAPAWLLALAHPGIAAVVMGFAFPLLFVGRVAAGWLVAANLAGSVLACAIGGNVLVPLLGLGATARIGAAAYALAALAALATRRTAVVAAPARDAARVDARLCRAVALAGFATVGFEVLLLRRLPFFLEGFQPTLSGVLAACLLSLALGAALAPLVSRPGCAPGSALVAAGVAISLGLAEHVAPAVSRMAVASDLGLHARVWLASLVVAAPACVALGAVVPLAIEATGARGTARPSAAGVLFFVHGLGGVAGALFAGHLLPALTPTAYFAWLPVALAVALVAGAPSPARVRAVAGSVVLLLAATGWSGAGRPWAPASPVAGSRYDRPDRFRHLAHRTDSTVTASVVYDRGEHSMVLFTDEFRAAYTGPGTEYMKVLGHLPFALRDGLRDVAVIALGTGTTAHAVCAWPGPESVHVVEISPAVLELAGWFGGDGPVRMGEPPAFLRDPRTILHVTDGRAWIERCAPASLDLVTMEPLLPYAPNTAPLYSAEFYAAARRALRPDGLVVQWVPTHAMPAPFFDTLLGTFGRAFAHTSAWLVDQSTLLVGSDRPHLPSAAELERRLDSAPESARRMLHEAGLARGVDFEVAHVGVGLGDAFAAADVLHDERPFLEHIGYWSGERRLGFLPENLGRLDGLVRSAGWGRAPSALADARRARLRGAIVRARAILPVALGGEEPALAIKELAAARALAPDSVLLHREETLAWRLERERRVRQLDGRAAVEVARRHLARDEGSPALLALGRGGRLDEPFPLESVSELPGEPAALLGLAVRADALGTAVRGAFAVRCARAAVAVAAMQPLEAPELLASVFDPATLDALAAAVVARDGDLVREIGPLWRSDLPMPRGLERLGAEDRAARRSLAALLAGHRDPRALAALADLLVDSDLDVREAAAVALHRSWRDRVPYDPQWPESRRREAARAVRALHNPGR